MDVKMEEEDIDMYSSPYDNYLRIVNTIRSIEMGVRFTEDWYEEHKKHILKYRENFPNFHQVNQDFEDVDFRKKATEVETIMSNLVHEIEFRGTFNVKLYLILNKHLKTMCELIWGEEELLQMLGQMRM